MNLQQSRISFIGAGNMATALIQGLVANGVAADSIFAADPSEEQLKRLSDQCSVKVTSNNTEAIKDADVIVMAVKPQVMADVLSPLKDHLRKQSMLISIAAGVTLSNLEALCDDGQAIVRCMPNTPALVSAGASALLANSNTSDDQKKLAADILAAVGTVNWLRNEAEMDTVTALSGSGPAYFFLMIEAMADSAIAMGLDENTARSLAIQTALGSAKLAASSDVEVEELRRRVTSPGGTTEAAIKQFEQDNFRDIVNNALQSAALRSRELSMPTNTNR